MLYIINCQYTHNQGKFSQNFQFFHIYTSFSVNLHYFLVEKPNFGRNYRNFAKFRPKFCFRRMAGFGAKTKRRTLRWIHFARSSRAGGDATAFSNLETGVVVFFFWKQVETGVEWIG